MRHWIVIFNSLSTNFSMKSSKLMSNCWSMVLSLHEAASSQSKRLYFGWVCGNDESDTFWAVFSIDRLSVWICSIAATYLGCVNCRILYWRSDTNFPNRKPTKFHIVNSFELKKLRQQIIIMVYWPPFHCYGPCLPSISVKKDALKIKLTHVRFVMYVRMSRSSLICMAVW